MELQAVCLSLHHMGTSLSAAPPVKPTPQVSALSPVWALRLRRHVESSQITQSLASQTLSSHSWNVEESSWPSAWGLSLQTTLFLPRLLLTRHPHGPLGSPSVVLMVSTGLKCVHRKSWHYGLVPGPQWGSPTPRFSPRFHMIPDGEGPYREGLSHIWGLQEEWGLEPTRSLER